MTFENLKILKSAFKWTGSLKLKIYKNDKWIRKNLNVVKMGEKKVTLREFNSHLY